MSLLFPQEIILVSIAVGIVSIIIILIFQFRKRDAAADRMSESIYTAERRKGERRAHEIIWDAMKRGRAVVIGAEIEGLKHTAEKRVEARKIAAQHTHDLESLGKEAKALLAAHGERIEKLYEALEEGLASKTAAHLEVAAKRFTELLAAHDARIEDFLKTMEGEARGRVGTFIETELAASRRALKEYQAGRMKMIDDHARDLLERAIGIVLQKKLSLEEHAGLAEQALEEAKKEGWL